MRPFSHWRQHPVSVLLTLGFLFIVIPLASRYGLGWSHPFGYLSDLAIGCLLVVLLHQRSVWLSVPLILIWCVFTLGTAELVTAVGRMPTATDLHYLTDTQFLRHSTQGSGLSHPLLALALAGNVVIFLLLRWRLKTSPRRTLSQAWLLLPLGLLATHTLYQYRSPSETEQWLQFNLPHKLLAEGLNASQSRVEDWLDDGTPDSPADIAGLVQLDLDGSPLLSQPGSARNVLIITLEGIPGAYIAASRKAIHSSYRQAPMPRLSQWAERGMLTPDYVLHGHQTIRGLYAMLCGDYNKLDSGTPKGVELLNNPQRSQQCLPAQLREHGFSTHYLQGAGLRFMAKDQIMPRMGFDTTLGRDWFKNPPYQEFPWGMDDKAFFEGALGYVQQLRSKQQPWMLTLLTVGTHQPYSAPTGYLERFPNAKQAAIAYLDDAVADFLVALEQQGVLKDTLIIVTSDESHGLENVRLASAWGFNLLLAPEQTQLPRLKRGVYGHVDLTASVLDYFALPIPSNLSGRSLLRDYAHGREIISYTNGLLRLHDGKGTLTECDFQHICRRYASQGFIADSARYLGRLTGKPARLIDQRAALLDQSLRNNQGEQRYQFANSQQIVLKPTAGDDWADNLVGAQYLELPKGSQTTVNLKVRAVRMDSNGARLQLKTKEFDREVILPVPELPLLTLDHPIALSFTFNNLDTRKAFSFHLLGQGRGTIEITDFSVVSEAVTDELLSSKVGVVKPKKH
ncbi:phosphoglycerol transferase MdoB-like AlkP superfamily enzyme [Pseudomonas sp. SJZ079]|uniref:LTA synthase family protein n=1 Tax=Pseudomonas sp. SJZ079 TaxID=2572887 RepID=UPI00119984BD|nr:LTA synthase family protein [Pseudomonas sp. SJZ079]TWC43090.1 phosphoglycerol transferase MdoB-like AlkP superfamily enzyme [Pseudomonas sp. SJZ079]